MFARCPSCQSIYQLTASDLAAAAGVVRCGHCGKTFNSLAQLFADHPRSDEQPVQGGGMPPLLEQRSIRQPELPGVSLAEDNWSDEEPGPSLALPTLGERPGTHRAWLPISLMLAAALLAQLGWQWSRPDSALYRLTSATIAGLSPADAAQTIQIVSRDMHRHPTLDDAIIISASLRNPSSQLLEWPVLEVRLYDPSQQVLGARRLPPEEYLEDPRALERGMGPGLIVPVILEFVVGTTEPSGFDFRFL